MLHQVPKPTLVDRVLTSPSQGDPPKLDKPFVCKLLDIVKERLEEEGDRELMVNTELALHGKDSDHIGKQTLRLSDIPTRTRKAAKVLHHLGLRRDDVVQLSLPNTTEFPFPILATWLCKGIVSPVDPAQNEQACQGPLEDTRPKFVFCCEANKDTLVGALRTAGLNDTKIIVMDFTAKDDRINRVYSFEKLLEESEGFDDLPEIVDFNPDDTFALLWSSGTTSRPKAIRVPMKVMAAYFHGNVSFVANQKYLVTSQFFHGSGFSLVANAIINKAIIYFFPLSALASDPVTKITLTIDRFKPTTAYLGGSIVMALCFMENIPRGIDLSSLKVISPIGTGIRADSPELLKKHFTNLESVPNLYGMTELFGPIASSETHSNLGYILPGVTLKIVDTETNEICGPNQVGEMQAKSPRMTPGYFNRPEEDAKLYTADGFIRTGDLGHYDKEGILYYNGRCKELIKYKRCIHPSEIESIILKHPGVKEVAVFGRQDPVLIEAITAVVMKKEGSFLTEDELIKMVEDQAEDCMRLRGGVIFVKELPRNAIGKVVQRKLRELFP